ncbi:hypothetical protein C5167_044616 [Papaver somniferum]|uniref:Uncharacterized protein n=1 Tax=Papaver somniferum TaxID=3469 RepID=A0A4Y7L976_PAPSO|nr:hypothetical protein C5167_044616 [Papaver somniferum]
MDDNSCRKVASVFLPMMMEPSVFFVEVEAARSTVDSSHAAAVKQVHHLEISMEDFTTHGSFASLDNQWHDNSREVQGSIKENDYGTIDKAYRLLLNLTET